MDLQIDSVFGGVTHDIVASSELKSLRALFMSLEDEFNTHSYGVLSSIVFPHNEYSDLAHEFTSRILATPLDTPENIKKAIVLLDVLFNLVGKDIRLRLIDRIKKGTAVWAKGR